MLSDKEKKAIENLKELSHYCSFRMLDLEDKNLDIWARFVLDMQIIKNLIEKQSKMIDLMAEKLTSPINDKEWVIKYYEKKVGE